MTEAFGSKVDWKPDPSGTGEGGIDISLTKSDGTKILVKMHTLVKTVIIERTPPGAFQPEVIRYEMEVAPFIVRPAGRTVVPIRFISEAFDAKVDWNATSQEITITFVP